MKGKVEEHLRCRAVVPSSYIAFIDEGIHGMVHTHVASLALPSGAMEMIATGPTSISTINISASRL